MSKRLFSIILKWDVEGDRRAHRTYTVAATDAKRATARAVKEVVAETRNDTYRATESTISVTFCKEIPGWSPGPHPKATVTIGTSTFEYDQPGYAPQLDGD